MDPIPGFISIPRLAGHVRPAGAFFSATVLAQAGTSSWTIRLEGQTFTVSLPGSFTPGQVLRLKLVAQQAHRWEFQLLRSDQPRSNELPTSSLALAFLSRGLPIVSERLTAWSRWLQRPGPSDKEAWAASLEAHGAGPHSPLTEAIAPWLAWQAALERGETPAPPDDSVWDEWNAQPAGGDPWLVVPLHWEYEGSIDSGLLQAHWNPQRQAIDRWHVTAAPRGHGFRLEAYVKNPGLELVWRFFQPEDRAAIERWWRSLDADSFSRPGLPVSLAIDGPVQNNRPPRGGIDVEA